MRFFRTRHVACFVCAVAALLIACLCMQVWPHTNSLRKMATVIKKRTDGGDKNAFVFMDLREFLPNYCPEFAKVSLDPDADSQVDACALSMCVGLRVCIVHFSGGQGARQAH